MATGTVRTEEADLVYDYEGTGPVLLAIAGGGGGYAAISGALADGYTVVRDDRRGRARSTAGPTPGFDIAQQARDAAAVIRVFGEQAYVLGNSSGANIGLALMSDHPELVIALVAHEPPATGILPDADAWLSFVDEVRDAYLAGGFQAAMRMFTGSLTGMGQFGSRRQDDDSRPPGGPAAMPITPARP
jgi:pimeloyl-ACP methyl ester carboxylesterase